MELISLQMWAGLQLNAIQSGCNHLNLCYQACFCFLLLLNIFYFGLPVIFFLYNVPFLNNLEGPLKTLIVWGI